VTVDHIILNVNDLDETVAFYTEVLGFVDEGSDGPFRVLRVSEDFAIQVAPWGTKGNEHYAFALDRAEFDAVFQRIKDRGIPYGDAFDSVGSNRGPGSESGARGLAPTIYFYDPSHHLLEIRSYEKIDN
jgi:catechol 2,3-dioxygenase-like lactoylglutathione lyase family enzyme